MNTDDVLTYISLNGHNLEDMKKIRLAANKAVNAYREEAKPVTHHYTMWSMDAARGLWAMVKEHYPFMPEPKLEQWAEDIDKLHRIDGYNQGLIAAVLRWSQQDVFWRQQVRSGANLRKHFVKVLVRIKEEQNKKGRVYTV